MVRCLFCHSSVPDEKSSALYLMQFDVDSINDLWLRGHDLEDQESHPMAPHFVTPSDDLMEAIDTSEERRKFEPSSRRSTRWSIK